MNNPTSPTEADRWPARVRTAGRNHCGRRWHLGPETTRRWRDLDLWVLIEGRGQISTPEGVIPLGSGSCLFLRGGEDYRFEQDPEHRFLHFWAHFDYCDRRGSALCYRDLSLPSLHRRFARPDLLFSLFERVVEAFVNGAQQRCDRWFGALLMELAHEDAAPTGLSPIQRRIIELCARTREHPEDAPGVAAMAHELDVSRSYFCRSFRAQVGAAPRDFVIAERMRLARQLLAETELAVGAIAERLGYRDVYFFSRHFAQQHGLPPSRYRASV